MVHSAQQLEAQFLAWAKTALAPLNSDGRVDSWEDLVPLGKMIGDTPVVALSEAAHCIAEPLDLRNRIFRYLVEHHGFTTIAIESGLAESRILQQYIQGAVHDISSVLLQGVSWTFHHLRQNRELLEWMRSYNLSPRHSRKLSIYGFDIVPTSSINTPANRTILTTIAVTLDYLTRVDPTMAAGLRARFEPLTTVMQAALGNTRHACGYQNLSQVQRDALTACIADLMTLLERQERNYIAASSAEDYAWTHQAMVCARLADGYLRHLPLGWHPGEIDHAPIESMKFLFAARDVRDRAQADNLDWIVRRRAPGEKVLVFGHRYHLSAVPMKLPATDGTEHLHEVAGTYLKRRLGSQLIVIGHLIGEGQMKCVGFEHTLPRAPEHTVDGLAGKLGAAQYVLDLRQAPGAVKTWLAAEHELAHEPKSKIPLTDAFDILLYTDAVSPACV